MYGWQEFSVCACVCARLSKWFENRETVGLVFNVQVVGCYGEKNEKLLH